MPIWGAERVTMQNRIGVACIYRQFISRKSEQATPRIKWWRLKGDNLKVQFREKVLDKVRPVESVQYWWEETSTTILRVGQEMLDMTTSLPRVIRRHGGGTTRCRR